jgi:hypothetical protein
VGPAAGSTLSDARAAASATTARTGSVAAGPGAPRADDGLPEGEAPVNALVTAPGTATVSAAPASPREAARARPELKAIDPPAVGRQPRRGTGWLIPSTDGVVEVDGRRFRVRAQGPLEVSAGRHQVRWIEPLARGQSLTVRAGARRPLRPERRARGTKG